MRSMHALIFSMIVNSSEGKCALMCLINRHANVKIVLCISYLIHFSYGLTMNTWDRVIWKCDPATDMRTWSGCTPSLLNSSWVGSSDPKRGSEGGWI